MKMCVIADNEYIFENFMSFIEKRPKIQMFDFYYSTFSRKFSQEYLYDESFKSIALKDMGADFFDRYNLYIPLHCKQLFPKNIEKVGTCRKFLNVLRATTFEKYDNAYFIDGSGNKVYVTVEMKKISGGGV